MSAPNFYAKSGKYFVIEAEHEFELDDARDNITAAFESDPASIYTEERDESDGNRNYPGHAFIKIGLKNEREDMQAQALIIARSGYYTGVNFDIDLSIYDGYTGEYLELDEIDAVEVRDSLESYHDKRPTLKSAEATLRRLQADASKLEKIAERILTEYTTPLIKVGQFSNGEAVYEKQLLRG